MAGPLNYVDRYTSTLASGYTSGGGSLSVSVGPTGISGACYFLVIVQAEGVNTEEVLLVTNISGTTLTVTGAQAGTSASNHGAGAVIIGSIMSSLAYSQQRQDYHPMGAIASLPSAGSAGRIYYATDSVYDAIRDNGSSWDYFYRGSKVTPPGSQSFSFVNQGSATATQQTNGVLVLSSPSNGNADNLRMYVFTAPATPWTRTFRIRPLIAANNFNLAGICMRESATSKIITFGQAHVSTNGGPDNDQLSVVYWTNSTTHNTDLDLNGMEILATELTLQIADDGTNISFKYSNDNGITYLSFFSELRGAHFTTGPNQIGLVVNPNNATGSPLNAVTCVSID